MQLPNDEQIAYMVAHKDETQQRGIYAVCVICLAITPLMVVLRFLSRHIGRVPLKITIGLWWALG